MGTNDGAISNKEVKVDRSSGKRKASSARDRSRRQRNQGKAALHKALPLDSGETNLRLERAARKREGQIDAAVRRFAEATVAFETCLATQVDVANCRPAPLPDLQLPPGTAIAAETANGTVLTDEPATEPQVMLTAEQVAYMAFVKIKLTPPTPGIGPSPNINPWKMAAVGYPLWLWGAGATDPPEVTDSIAGLFVSLNPTIDHIDFTMGDGTTLTCHHPTTPWTPNIPAGQKSPTCGHTYQQPSLPKGTYTITATTHWSIAWNANGQTGTIPFTQTATTTLPVGELQALVR